MQSISTYNGILDPAPHFSAFRDDTALEWTESHVFLIKTDSYFEKIRNSYAAVLSETELQKAGKFLKSEDAKNYIVRRYFLRKVLSEFLKCNPEAIHFQQSANKKPRVEGIQFNLSHSENLVAVALSPHPIGIDVEFIRKDFSYDVMLDDCFSIAEQLLIHKGAGYLNFFTLWTRKEALLKATGEGLNNHKLSEIQVLLATNTRHGRVYQLFSSLVLENYALSIAVTSPSKIIHYWSV